ncbi:unnamed protein product [Lactuca saligna]|uniref:NADP-dependent oxidoreductase domain-containing protein n=1 Tax=Lactuca saligna TaxID=75948 RepID=A0AA35YQ36_LACSI|nr:unnamed protein product [Lactuca saligna]
MLYERVSAIAVKKGCTPSQLALAWVHHQGKDVVPIPGTTKIENLQQNIGALSVKLTPQDMAELESPLGLETTATFDPQTDEFVLHSPTLTSSKARDGTNMYDFTYVENVAHALVCAERALASDGSASKRAAGEAYFGAGLSGVLAWCVRVGRNQPNAPGVLAPSIFTSYVSRVLFNALAVFALREIHLSKVS